MRAPGARPALLGGAAFLAGLLLTGCLPIVDGSGDDAGDRDRPESAPPGVGQCHDTPDAVLADAHDPTPPVACDRPHTLETYAVLHADRPLDKPTVARMEQRCVRRIDAFLGGDGFARTTVGVYYFMPSRQQQADGARWVRCDAGVVENTGVSAVRQVTGSLQGAFTGGVPKTYRRCLNSPPDPARPQPLVPCHRPHVAEELPAGVDLGAAGDRYPGTATLTARANARCAEAVATGLPDAGRSLVVVPTPQMWRAGTTTAQCWALAAPGERLNGSEAQPA